MYKPNKLTSGTTTTSSSSFSSYAKLKGMMIGDHNRQHHTNTTTAYNFSSSSFTPSNTNNTTMAHHHHHHLCTSPSSLSNRYLHNHTNPTVNINNNTILSSSPSSPLSITDVSPPNTPRGTYLLSDYETVLAALSRYLPSNTTPLSDTITTTTFNTTTPSDEHENDLNATKYSTDEFRMYEFKVRGCTRAKAHDWTECPFAHPGEKARRRDPRIYVYTGTACTDFRKGNCRRGDSCEFAHGVFECWLHPMRYRTQACKDGRNCPRRVCFFAHTADELRILPSNGGGQRIQSPRGGGGGDPFDEVVGLLDSPPLTPLARSGGGVGYHHLDSSPTGRSGGGYQHLNHHLDSSSSIGTWSMNELAASLRNMQLEKVKSMPPANRWSLPNIINPSQVVGSPPSGIRTSAASGYFSLPVTPTSRLGNNNNTTTGYLDMWGDFEDESATVQRVESGRELRAKMFEKLSKENPLGVATTNPVSAGPDVGWVSELLK